MANIPGDGDQVRIGGRFNRARGSDDTVALSEERIHDGLAHSLRSAGEIATFSLTARYPKLDIDLSPALRSISLDRREADIAIRFDKPKDGDIIARPMVEVGYGFYGTEEACRSFEAAGNLVLIGFNEADGYLTQEKWVARHFPRARIAFRAKDQALHAIAARSGIGLALIPHYIGRANSTLRVCDLGAVPSSREVFLLTRSRDRKDASIRVVADEVADMFEQERDLFV
ncbi:substrate-binding domain-containing protein [Pseudomonas sp. S2_H01]